jgi:hypothetical protein
LLVLVFAAQVRNIIQRVRSTNYQPGDIHELVKKLLKEEGTMVEYEVDNSGALRRIFWAYKEQLNAAAAWADVVLQDNTCKTNIYGLPLCAFVGIDGNNR